MNGGATVGARLRRAREARGLSLSEAAEASGVGAASTVQRLEGGQPAELVDDVRLMAWLRVYARFLGLDAEAVLHEATAAVTAPAPADAAAGTRARRRRRVVAGAIAAAVVLLGAAGVIAGRTGDGQLLDLALFQLLDALSSSEPSPVSGAAGSRPATAAPPSPAAGPDRAGAGSGEAMPASPTTPATELPGRPPEQTRVQLLDGSAGTLPVGRAEQALADLGYDVVRVAPMIEPAATSAVYYTEGWRTEARSLSRRAPRFASVGANPGFDADVDLHVVVGTDWPAATPGGAP